MNYLKGNNNTYIFNFNSYFWDPLIECSNLGNSVHWIYDMRKLKECVVYRYEMDGYK